MTDTNELPQDKVIEIMRGDRFCMLTSVAQDGELQSHPMTPQQVSEAGDVWFFIDTTSDQADNLRAQPHVNIAFADGSTWLSVSGRAELTDNQAKRDELWNDMVEAWFPEGKDSNKVGLVLVTAESAQYWDTKGGLVSTALAFAKAKATGERPDVGESQSVDL